MAMRSQRGFLSFQMIFFLTVIGAVVIGGAKVIPAYYEFNQLKDLADRVSGEMGSLSRDEVKKRVYLEFNRNHLAQPVDVFKVKRIRKGYRVTIDYSVPMEFQGGLLKFEPLRFYYRKDP